MLGFRWIFGGGGRLGEENLDRPESNFDIAGIPTEQWSSNLFQCYQNIVPSCVLSFFCPCTMFSQIIIRAQIPFFIALKNSMACLRRQSGYGFFIDMFMWSLIVSIGLILVLIFIKTLSTGIKTFIGLIIVVLLGSLFYFIGHLRIAFKAK